MVNKRFSVKPRKVYRDLIKKIEVTRPPDKDKLKEILWPLFEKLCIKAAFLQGNKVDRDIFVIPPKDIREDSIIWKLNKVAYRLSEGFDKQILVSVYRNRSR